MIYTASYVPPLSMILVTIQNSAAIVTVLSSIDNSVAFLERKVNESPAWEWIKNVDRVPAGNGWKAGAAGLFQQDIIIGINFPVMPADQFLRRRCES